MADFIRYTVEDRIATLVIDHPPVNALNRQTLTELDAGLDELIANSGVKHSAFRISERTTCQ